MKKEGGVGLFGLGRKAQAGGIFSILVFRVCVGGNNVGVSEIITCVTGPEQAYKKLFGSGSRLTDVVLNIGPTYLPTFPKLVVT